MIINDLDRAGDFDRNKIITQLKITLDACIPGDRWYAYVRGYIAAISEFVSVREARYILREIELHVTKMRKERSSTQEQKTVEYLYDCKCKECRDLPPEITWEEEPITGSQRNWWVSWVAPHLRDLPYSEWPPNYNYYLRSHIGKQAQVGRHVDVDTILEIDWLTPAPPDEGKK